MNAILGQKVAITSPRVQTTRTRITGVLTLEKRGQIVFLDTPGFSKAHDAMGELMSAEGRQALADADGFLFVVDGTASAGSGDAWLAQQLQATQKYVLLVINKVDQMKSPEKRQQISETYRVLFADYPDWDFLTVSAQTGKRIQDVSRLLIRHLPPGEPIYAEDDVTDQTMRAMAQEMIREQVMRLTHDELPHSVAVLVESFNEADPACVRIAATLFVDQASQKGMLVGKQGQMIKTIGQRARKEIEAMVETQVFLELNVKTKLHWRKDPVFLKLLGIETS